MTKRHAGRGGEIGAPRREVTKRETADADLGKRMAPPKTTLTRTIHPSDGTPADGGYSSLYQKMF